MPEEAVPQSRQPGREHKMAIAPEYAPRFAGSGRLKGRTALITGGDSGIGRAVAVLFAREGANIAIAYLEETKDAQETLGFIAGEGAACFAVAGDIGDEVFCRETAANVMERFGSLDVLVNNCAEQHPQESIADISQKQLYRTFQTNVFGYFHITKAALEHMKAGAAIVNTTSVTAFRGSHHLIDYAATRGAIVAFTRSLAASLVDRRIRVNAVAPGPIWTPLIPASFDKEKILHFGEHVPMGRPGQPNEVAPCHLFLACEDSSYMTGQVLHPNGGEAVSS